MLFHGSRASNFVGILSRGLLMPKCVNNANEQELTRTDIGHLGYGIYFSDDIRTSLKYALTSESKRTRLIAVCEVALGECKQMHDYDTTLTRAPQGFNSVRGVKRDENFESKFSDDEYVIYDLSQYRIKYIVEMHVPSTDGSVKSVSDGEMYLTNRSSNSKGEQEMDVAIVKVEKGKKNVKLNELGM